jgi:ubiquinone/menaquinone biosynthesis C-methylase UbiE
MSALAEKLRRRFYRDADHPYRVLERALDELVTDDSVILDAGCGRHAPVLGRFLGRAQHLVGLDLVDFPTPIAGIELVNADLGKTGLPDRFFDLVYSRSVMEHVADPDAVFTEMHRILRPGGRFVFLTANKWDYATLIAAAIPNRYHATIVNRTEGRAEEDVFPTQYKMNTKTAVTRLAQAHGFRLARFRYLGQYPNYFLFNGALFFLAMMYEKIVATVPGLQFLQGWILVELERV